MFFPTPKHPLTRLDIQSLNCCGVFAVASPMASQSISQKTLARRWPFSPSLARRPSPKMWRRIGGPGSAVCLIPHTHTDQPSPCISWQSVRSGPKDSICHTLAFAFLSICTLSCASRGRSSYVGDRRTVAICRGVRRYVQW